MQHHGSPTPRSASPACRPHDGRLKLLPCATVLLLIIAIHSSGDVAFAEAPAELPKPSPMAVTSEQARRSVEALANWAATRLPRVHEGDRDWGETKKVWSGVKLRFDGLELKTHRRYRELRHGRWARYRVSLPEVASVIGAGDGLQVRVDGVQQLPDGRWQIQSSIVAPLDFEARVERWNRGVQWYSVSVTGDLRIRLRTTATIGFVADYSEIPPALVIDPRVETAELVLEHFEVERISKIGGDVAEEFGDFLRQVLRERLIEKENRRLAAKLNEEIDEQRDHLRWSLADWFEKFGAPASEP